MVCKEKLVHLFDGLSEPDQKKAYEYIQSLAESGGDPAKEEEVVKLFGKHYFVVPD